MPCKLTFLKRKPIGRMKRSNFAGFRVKDSPTNVTFVTMRFHALRRDLPVLTTLKRFSITDRFHFRNWHFIFALKG